MIPARVVAEVKNVITLSLHPHHNLKVPRETAILRSMFVDRLAGMAVMTTPTIEGKAWDTALIRYVQGQYANKGIAGINILKKEYHG